MPVPGGNQRDWQLCWFVVPAGQIVCRVRCCCWHLYPQLLEHPVEHLQTSLQFRQFLWGTGIKLLRQCSCQQLVKILPDLFPLRRQRQP